MYAFLLAGQIEWAVKMHLVSGEEEPIEGREAAKSNRIEECDSRKKSFGRPDREEFLPTVAMVGQPRMPCHFASSAMMLAL
jgi:hypothetical protein